MNTSVVINIPKSVLKAWHDSGNTQLGRIYAYEKLLATKKCTFNDLRTWAEVITPIKHTDDDGYETWIGYVVSWYIFNAYNHDTGVLIKCGYGDVITIHHVTPDDEYNLHLAGTMKKPAGYNYKDLTQPLALFNQFPFPAHTIPELKRLSIQGDKDYLARIKANEEIVE